MESKSSRSERRSLGKSVGDWKPVTIVRRVDVWDSAVNATGRNLLVQSVNGDLQMVRASLLKSDFLMRSLGRPLREQIVSMRPSDLTTLEAIDLSNGSTLAGYLSKGAASLVSEWGDDKAGLIHQLFTFGFSRNPTIEEQTTLLNSFATPPTQQEVEDVLWAIFMMPSSCLSVNGSSVILPFPTREVSHLIYFVSGNASLPQRFLRLLQRPIVRLSLNSSAGVRNSRVTWA